MSDYTNPADGKPLVKWSPKKKSPRAPSSKEMVKEARKLRKAGYSPAQIARGLVRAGYVKDEAAALALVDFWLEE